MQLIDKKLFSLGVALLTLVAGFDPARVHAQSLPANISPEDIAAFKALPADQRKALMQQYAPDMAASDDGSGIPAADGPSGVPEGNGPKLIAGAQAPTGTVAPVVATTLQPGDAVFVELSRRNGGEPSDSAGQEFLNAINNRNPYDVKADGQLRLPGVPATRVAGLSTASAERIQNSFLLFVSKVFE